jgi:hypothetical protein
VCSLLPPLLCFPSSLTITYHRSCTCILYLLGNLKLTRNSPLMTPQVSGVGGRGSRGLGLTLHGSKHWAMTQLLIYVQTTVLMIVCAHRVGILSMRTHTSSQMSGRHCRCESYRGEASFWVATLHQQSHAAYHERTSHTHTWNTMGATYSLDPEVWRPGNLHSC